MEFLHLDKKSITNQREVGQASYARALKRVLGQDPDIVLEGELRNSESTRIALGGGDRLPGPEHAAYPGRYGDHKLHDRPLPTVRAGAVRPMLAAALKGLVGHCLVRTKAGEGRAAACDVMVTTGRIKDFILAPRRPAGSRRPSPRTSTTGCRRLTRPLEADGRGLHQLPGRPRVASRP